jgi:SAM-dependent methyltransferase
MPPDHDDGIFGEEAAARYDDDAALFAPEAVDPVVDFLVERARSGRALEFAIGTGRIAVPLAARGIEVAGIEISRPMAARVAEKPGGDRIGITIGDMATARVIGEFSLVYLVFNTIGNLITQDAQVACFENAARHLEPGGAFVIENTMPPLRRLPPGARHVVFHHSADRWGVDEIDVVTQQATSHHLSMQDREAKQFRTPFRYVWPAELDLMARIAGMHLGERWGGWNGEPFTAESEKHVSVWEKPGG